MNTLLQLAILVINIFIYAGMFYLLYRFCSKKIPEIDLYLSQFRKQKHNTDNDKNKKDTDADNQKIGRRCDNQTQSVTGDASKKSEEPQNRALHFYFYCGRGVQFPCGIQCAGAVRSPPIMPASMWILPSSSNRRISVWVEFSDRLF